MKTKFLIFIVLTSLFFSCAPISYYQVYKVQPDNNIKQSDSTALVYENEDCKITYNFLTRDAGFMIYNKTNSMLYLNLVECFFIKNGIAFDYYKSKTVTETESSTLSSTNTATVSVASTTIPLAVSNSAQSNFRTTTEHGVSYLQKEIVLIPSNTAKYISEYSITNDIYRDCDLLRFPNSEKEIKTKEFNPTNSPYKFSNRLSYKIGENGTSKNIENTFYVKEITNMPKDYFIRRGHESFCHETSFWYVEVPKYNSANMFYIQYSKTIGNNFSH